jgi:sugar lactone lactonase YvrE
MKFSLPLISRAAVIIALLLQIITASADTEPVKLPDTEFVRWQTFSQGEKPEQLLWLSEPNGGVVDGPFQGPMAFITDRNANLWVGDTLNARISAFSQKGRPIRTIDLILSARQAGLASDPVLVTLTPGMPGKLLVGDAANNAIIEIDLRKAPPRAFLPTASGNASWKQINHVHCDQQGKIYIEDVASRRTFILNRDGKAEATPLEGMLGIAVAGNGKIAVLAADEKNSGLWQILTADKHGSKLQPLAFIRDDEPVMWAALQGYDARNRLHAIYDTPSSRFYMAIAADGSIVRKYQTRHPDPGYDPTRPDWVDANGRLYTVRIKGQQLEILTLK